MRRAFEEPGLLVRKRTERSRLLSAARSRPSKGQALTEMVQTGFFGGLPVFCFLVATGDICKEVGNSCVGRSGTCLDGPSSQV